MLQRTKEFIIFEVFKNNLQINEYIAGSCETILNLKRLKLNNLKRKRSILYIFEAFKIRQTLNKNHLKLYNSKVDAVKINNFYIKVFKPEFIQNQKNLHLRQSNFNRLKKKH